MKKRAFEMSFTTIFSIVVGTVILFLAIYIAVKMVSSNQQKLNQETSAQLSIFFDPLETSLESGKSRLISFSSKITIYNDKCVSYGDFGSQTLGVDTTNSKTKEADYGKMLNNKYIFSQKTESGKDFYVLSKPLIMPFKISDLLILTSTNYCFVDSPEVIKDDLNSLNAGLINFTDSTAACSKQSTIVCFSPSSSCNINVYGENNFDEGYVSKENSKIFYKGSLIYAAIFSSPEVYECNVKRLMLRASSLADLYSDKIDIENRRGIYSNMQSKLITFSNLAQAINSSSELYLIYDTSDDLIKINEVEDVF
jgi:hypothetical protein